MMHHGMRFLALSTIVVCLLLSGCGSRDTEASSDEAALRAKAIAAHYGPTTAFTADMRIIAKPVEGDLLSFSVSLWGDSDGRLRLSGKKFNVHFIEGIVETDNTFTAVLVRDKAVVTGSLSDIASAVAKGEAAGGAAFSELGTISSVLKQGPLATASNWRFADPAEGNDKLLVGDIGKQSWEVAFRGMQVTNSTLKDADGSRLFGLRYTHEKDFDRLIRAQGNHLSVEGDDSTYLFRLQRFASVPGVSDSSMKLNVPPDWERLNVEQFLDLLVAPE